MWPWGSAVGQPRSMHSLVFLCARRLLGHAPGARRALPVLPAELYPVLFRAAFLDGRALALRDLVGAWPFPLLSPAATGSATCGCWT